MGFNPFDLRGPEFLVFYFLFALGVTYLVRAMRRGREATTTQTFDLAQDPYQIAYLRGGKNHLLQVAVFSLLDRGLLKVSGANLRTAGSDFVEKVRRPLEKAILWKFLKEDKITSLYSDPNISDQVEDAGERLREAKLLPDKGQQLYRLVLCLGALLLLWGVTGTKITVALSRGHKNIGFLIILTLVFTFVAWKTTNPHRTAAGDKEYDNLKMMFSGLDARKESLRPHGTTNELVLLAALFGLSALPAAAAEMIEPLKLRPVSDSGVGGGCGSGSSDGGSCGGGCGGGCGGCG